MHERTLTSRATVLGENGSAIFVGPPWRIVGPRTSIRTGLPTSSGDSTGDTQMWLMNGHRVVGRTNVDADPNGGDVRVGQPWSIISH